MNLHRAALICVVGLSSISCSEKWAPDRDNTSETPEPSRDSAHEPEPKMAETEAELQPAEDEIGEDCLAFVRATTVIPAQISGADCPACPAEGREC